MKLTEEQAEIVGTDAGTLVVDAFAGSGKTSTLVAYARARPGRTFTYLAFNKAIKEDAQRRFPPNVRCVTTHGLAYRDFGVPYQHKLGQPRETVISREFQCSYRLAKAAMDAVGNFLCSADKEILPVHATSGMADPDAAFGVAREIWRRMRDAGDAVVQMPHDGYLKLYQLSDPEIRSDIILVDEAQDSNPAVLDVVARQGAAKIYVGDENQSIYSFRKAVNALAKIDADRRLVLTSSFRFGPGIAALATLLLCDWKGETRMIEGLGRHKTRFEVDEGRPHAVIGRTNSGLFDAAVDVLMAGKPFGYVGGIQGYRMDMIRNAYNLSVGERVSDPFLASFRGFAEMEEYAEAVEDKELKMLVKVIDEYEHDVPVLIDRLKSKAVAELSGEEIALTTAHKSKGLEFESVRLLDDFTDLKVDIGKGGVERAPSIEDINLLYVAATRAERCLAINDATWRWLDGLDMRDAVMGGDVSPFVKERIAVNRHHQAIDEALSIPDFLRYPALLAGESSARREDVKRTRANRFLRMKADALGANAVGDLFA